MSDLAAIRKTHGNHSASQAPACDGCCLLAHIDALTAKVGGLPHHWDDGLDESTVSRAAVLAILRGEA